MRKLLAAILALAMLLSVTSFALAEDPITVTVFRGDPGDQPTDDNKIYKMIEEEFGINFRSNFWPATWMKPWAPSWLAKTIPICSTAATAPKS